MVDPIYTYIGGIAFLVLIIGSMLYLTFSTMDIEEGDEHPSQSVVGGVEQDEEEFVAENQEGVTTEEVDETEAIESGSDDPVTDAEPKESTNAADGDAEEETDDTPDADAEAEEDEVTADDEPDAATDEEPDESDDENSA